MTVRRLLEALLCIGAILVPATGGAAGASTLSPTVVADAIGGQVGDLVPVTLEHWPTGLVTLTVCGGGAARGSEDCDLRSAFTVNMPEGGGMRVRVMLVRPPADCPCVVRAATVTNELVRTVPISIAGVPSGAAPTPAATSTSAAGVTARASVLDDETWSDAFGVGVRKTVRVTLRNRSGSATPPLEIGGGVGRVVEHGESFATRAVAPIAPGARRTVDIPISLSAPAHGRYVVFGTIYGLDAPVRFDAKTDNDPWALWLLVPLALVVTARVLRRRERKRAAASVRDLVAPVEVMPMTAPVTEIVLEPFEHCSPEVWSGDGGRYPTHSYDLVGSPDPGAAVESLV